MAAVAGSIVAAGALAAGHVFGRAAVRYRILAAAFALVALIGPSALAFAALRPAGVLPGVVSSAGSAFGVTLEPLLTILLGVGVALLVELVLDVARLRRIKRAARQLGMAAVRNAQIGTSAAVTTPTAIGYLHPAIVVPSGFRERVDATEWNAVLAHEVAHLARCDDWAKALQSAVLRMGWWLPGLWILARALDLERELASDESAVGAAGARRYAACLLRLATGDCADAVAPALFGRRSHLAIRVERLLRPAVPSTPIVRAVALGAFTAGALALVVSAMAVVPSVGRHAARVAVRVHGHHAAAGATRAHHATVVAARTARRPPAVVATPADVSMLRTVAVPRPHAIAPPVVASPPVRHRARIAAVAARVPAVVAYRSLDAVTTNATPAPFPADPNVASVETGSGPASAIGGMLWLRLPRAVTIP